MKKPTDSSVSSSAATLQENLEILQSHAASLSQLRDSRQPNLTYREIAHQASHALRNPTDASGDVYIHPELRSQVAPEPNMMSAPVAQMPGAPGVPIAAPDAPQQLGDQHTPGPQQLSDQHTPGLHQLTPQAQQPPHHMQAQGHSMQATQHDAPIVGDGRKGKRELSQSKRAAQNRAAQRAFRQRKETYIKDLERQVRDLKGLEQSYKELMAENHALREYIIHLQSRLIDAQREIPPPPQNINLNQTTAPPPPTMVAPTNVPEPPPSAPHPTLEAVAQAVAHLEANQFAASAAAAQQQHQHQHTQHAQHVTATAAPPPQGSKTEIAEDSRTAEEINRQLQGEIQEALVPPSGSSA